MNHREMWKRVFGDTDKYIDFYFKEKANKSIAYSKYDKDELASMAFFTPYKMIYKGVECTCPYIVGVATQPEFRHRGYMKTLLEQGLMDAEFSGAPLAFLSPADERIYEPLGFQGVYYRNQIEVTGDKNKWYTVSSFSRLEAEVKKKIAEFANAQLYMANLDLYVQRSVEYYELLYKEAKALGGKVIVLREGAFTRGVACYVHEEDFYEITELICDPEDGQKVMESICAYVRGPEREKVIFSDGYFLTGVTGDGVTIRRSEKPYIMVKALTEENIDGLKVYINDIT